MRPRSICVCMSVCIAILSLGAISAEAGEYLTAEQAKKLYTGAEFESTSRNGDPARVWYNVDGSYVVDINGFVMSGKWWVKKSGKYCFENDNGATGCWWTKHLGGKKYQNVNDNGRTRIQTFVKHTR